MNINVETTCRICLKNMAVQCIFTFKYEKCLDSVKTTCYEMMKSVLSFTGEEGDRLPDKLCEICLSELSAAYRLKLTADRSEKILRHHFLEDQLQTEELKRFETVLDSTTDIKDEVLDDSIYYEENSLSSESEHDNLPLARISSTKTANCQVDKKEIKSPVTGAGVGAVSKKPPREPYYCSLCHKYVKNGNKHRNSVHSSRPKKFSCAVCGKAFSIQSKLTNHSSVHSQEKNFPCSVCGKLFRTNTLSITHRRKVHEKLRPFICHFCCKAFFDLFALKEHLRTHTRERLFPCRQCPRAFFTTRALRVHQRLHSAPVRLPCTLCPTKCTTKGNLKIHMQTHSKEKSHACKYCGVKFGRSYHRDRHQKTTHEDRLKFC